MSLENVTHPFYAIENYIIPSMPLFLIFHSLYAIGVKNTNGAVKLKDKRTIIPLAPIPCPLSTTTDVWDPHVRFIFNLEPIGSTMATEGPARAAEARAAPPPRPPLREPPHASRPPSGPCRGRRQAGHRVRRVLRHRPHPPPHPCSGAVAHCVLRRGSRPPPHPCPSCRRAGRRACRALAAAVMPSAAQAGSSAGSSLPRPPILPLRLRASCACYSRRRAVDGGAALGRTATGRRRAGATSPCSHRVAGATGPRQGRARRAVDGGAALGGRWVMEARCGSRRRGRAGHGSAARRGHGRGVVEGTARATGDAVGP